jgi:ectoine hydroxylase-related dioxygenase (phytanoyl-CoA dioxygenase family)
MDMHLEDALIRDACTAPAMVGAVGALLGATPLVCNSLLFEWGSQQEPHFDTFFMPSNTRNMMAASWVALDSVTKTNGPLFYYPKSHLIEPYRFSHGGMKAILPELQTGAAAHIDRIIREYELKKEEFYPEAGDVLIWHAQLLHGGSPIVNREETRRSLVTHYWTEVDFPLPEQRIDLGDGRWILKKPHSTVVDDEILAEVDVFLATMTPSPEMLSGVPETFDARRYLARNPDVLRAGESPWQHYINHGQREGRFW